MRFGLIHYRTPGDTLEQCLDFAASAGFEAVELMIGDVWPEDEPTPERRAERIRRLLDDHGIGASAVGAGNDFVHIDEAMIQHQVKRMDRVSRLAAIVGAKILRMEGGDRKPQVPREREAEAIAENLKRCVEFSERDDVLLAIDNHGVVTNDVDLLERVIAQVNSPRVGANLDTANFRWAGHSIEDCRSNYDRLAPQVLHIHLKDCIGSGPNYRGTTLGEGEVDIRYAVAALEAANYRGTYTAEWEGGADEDGGDAYKRCLDWMSNNIRRP